MPPKRSPPSTRTMTSSSHPPSASKGIAGVYQALTAKENQPVVRSIAIFGVSFLLLQIFFSTFSFLCEYRGLGGVRLVNRKIFCGRGGTRKDGGTRWQTVSRKWEKREGRGGGGGGGGGGKGAMNVIEEGKATWTACQRCCCSKTSTFHGRNFLCADPFSN